MIVVWVSTKKEKFCGRGPLVGRSPGAFLILVLLACTGSETVTTTLTVEEAAPPPAPVAESAFFVWYNPGKMVYRSADGKKWDPVAPLPADLDNWYNAFASDAGGRLYVVDIQDSVWTSGDGAKSWSKVSAVGERPAGMNDESLFICGGAANEIAAVSSAGRTYWSTDAGQSWTEKTRLAAEGAGGGGMGFQGGCAFSRDGSKVVMSGWYFAPQNPQLAISSDKGATWEVLPQPGTNVAANGLGFVNTGLAFARGGGYSPGIVSSWSDSGKAWADGAEIRGAAGMEYAQQLMATDGGNTVVVWQNPAKGSEGKPNVPAAAFVSTDGGKTFVELVGPVAEDPTPALSDEYQAMFWSNGKTPGPIPGPAAPVAAAPAEPAKAEAPKAPPEGAKAPEAPKAEAPKAEPAAEGKAGKAGRPDKQGKSIEPRKRQ